MLLNVTLSTFSRSTFLHENKMPSVWSRRPLVLSRARYETRANLLRLPAVNHISCLHFHIHARTHRLNLSARKWQTARAIQPCRALNAIRLVKVEHGEWDRQTERDGMRVGAFNTHTLTELNLTERNKCHRALKSLYVCLCASPLSPLNKNVASHGWRAIYLVSASTSVHINMPKKSTCTPTRHVPMTLKQPWKSREEETAHNIT